MHLNASESHHVEYRNPFEQVDCGSSDPAAIVGRVFKRDGTRNQRITSAAQWTCQLELERHSPSADVIGAQSSTHRFAMRDQHALEFQRTKLQVMLEGALFTIGFALPVGDYRAWIMAIGEFVQMSAE